METKLLLSLPFFSTLFLIIFKVLTTAIKAIKNGMYVINLSSSTNRLINIYNNVSKKEQIIYDKSKKINKDKFRKL